MWTEYQDNNIKLFLGSEQISNLVKEGSVVAIMLGGSRCINANEDKSDYDINIIVTDDRYYRGDRMEINGVQFHWYFHKYDNLLSIYDQYQISNDRYIILGLMQLKNWKILKVINPALLERCAQTWDLDKITRQAAVKYCLSQNRFIETAGKGLLGRTRGKNFIYLILAYWILTDSAQDPNYMCIIRNTYFNRKVDNTLMDIIRYLNENIILKSLRD